MNKHRLISCWYQTVIGLNLNLKSCLLLNPKQRHMSSHRRNPQDLQLKRVCLAISHKDLFHLEKTPTLIQKRQTDSVYAHVEILSQWSKDIARPAWQSWKQNSMLNSRSSTGSRKSTMNTTNKTSARQMRNFSCSRTRWLNTVPWMRACLTLSPNTRSCSTARRTKLMLSLKLMFRRWLRKLRSWKQNKTLI